jgi:hypothetical protein
MIRIILTTALITAVMSFDGRSARAYEAPWCAVISIGPGGVYWDCQYRSLEACVPNTLAGNRGFCNPNPAYSGPPAKALRKHQAWRR